LYAYTLSGADPGFVGPEAYTNSGTLCKKTNKKSDYKVWHESEYLFRAPPRALEGACVSEGP